MATTPADDTKAAKFKAAVETGKSKREQEHQNRSVRYQRFTELAATVDTPQQLAAMKLFADHEKRCVMAKARLWTTDDFESLKVLGEGSFGIVHLVKQRGTNDYFALKQMKKSAFHKKNYVDRIFAERDILADARSPWIVELHVAFQDSEHVYMAMEFLQGGDIIGHLLKKGRFTEEETSFYMAELLEALDVVHRNGFVHRDVKPDNAVLDAKGHLKLLDFGLCRQDPGIVDVEPVAIPQQSSHVGRTTTRRDMLRSMVGTPQYMAPEVYDEACYGPHSDLWSVAIITYECLVGHVPFHAGRTQGNEGIRIIRDKVRNHRDTFPRQLAKYPLTPAAERFLRGVICERRARLSADGCRAEPFFAGIDFSQLRELRPPIEPTVSAPDDARNFDDFDHRPLPPSRLGAQKDSSMEWTHFEFSEGAQGLLSKDVDFGAFFAQSEQDRPAPGGPPRAP